MDGLCQDCEVDRWHEDWNEPDDEDDEPIDDDDNDPLDDNEGDDR